MSSDTGGCTYFLAKNESDLLLYAVLTVIIIIAGGVFSMLKAAVTEANDKKLAKMADDGTKNARRLLRLTDKPFNTAAAMQLFSHVCVVSASVFGAVNVAVVLYAKNNVPLLWCCCVFAFFTVMAVSVLCDGVFGKLGEKYPEKIAVSFYPTVFLFRYAAYPFVCFNSLVSAFICKAFGVGASTGDEEVTEEEIRQMVDEGEELGVIPEAERVMINNIFEFNDITVGKIMTHRTDIVAIEKDTTFDEIVKTAAQDGYTRLPVYEQTLDSIVGILHIKTLLQYIDEHKKLDFKVEDYMTKPVFVPKSKTADELFKDMQKAKMHIAVVVDEYGGTAGIVTMENLIESILGDIEDEYDDEETDIVKLSDNVYVVLGSAEFGQVCEEIGCDFGDDFDAGFDFETVGGFVTGILDRIPQKGDSCEFENILFEVLDADDKKIDKIKLTVLPKTDGE